MTCTDFQGRHYETGTIINALAALGAVNPYTEKAYSEALAFGMGGGIAFGYFTFEYKGWLPHVSLLTRNTFAPFERILDGLGVRRETRQTTQEARAEELLRAELDAGNPAIVLADKYSLSYTGLNSVGGMWAMMPLLIVGQEDGDFLAVDGSSAPFRIAAKELSRARGKVKKDRFQLTVLEKPEPDRLEDGVRKGLSTCLDLLLRRPSAGSPKAFGLQGMAHWAEMLENQRNKQSWARIFPPGPKFYQAVAGGPGQPGVWDWIETWGTVGSADRGLFAAFLEEAAVILGRPELAGHAEAFRSSAGLWARLADASLPDDVEALARVKALKRRAAEVCWAGGDVQSIRSELKELKSSVTEESPIDEGLRSRICGEMRAVLLDILEVERMALHALDHFF